jgi:hypothetical protein
MFNRFYAHASLTCLLFLLTLSPTAIALELPQLDTTFKQARVRTEGDLLIVSSGKVEQTWRWTGHGLVTVGLRDVVSGCEWCTREPAVRSDWRFQGLIEDGIPCRLVGMEATTGNDDSFTSDHLRVVVEFAYDTKIALKLEIWAYPGAPGLRTQLFAKEIHGMDWVGPGRGRKSTRPGASGVVELSPFEFLDRLADLVPPPRKHRHRPAGGWRGGRAKPWLWLRPPEAAGAMDGPAAVKQARGVRPESQAQVRRHRA